MSRNSKILSNNFWNSFHPKQSKMIQYGNKSHSWLKIVKSSISVKKYIFEQTFLLAQKTKLHHIFWTKLYNFNPSAAPSRGSRGPLSTNICSIKVRIIFEFQFPHSKLNKKNIYNPNFSEQNASKITLTPNIVFYFLCIFNKEKFRRFFK